MFFELLLFFDVLMRLRPGKEWIVIGQCSKRRTAKPIKPSCIALPGQAEEGFPAGQKMASQPGTRRGKSQLIPEEKN